MQINGVGSSHSDMHHVTTCIHDTKHHPEGKVGGAAASASEAASSVTNASNRTNEPFSLSAWLQNTLSSTRKLLGRIWGDSAETLSGDMSAQTGKETLADIQAQEAAKLQSTALDMQSDLQSSLQQSANQSLQQNENLTGTLHTAQIDAASAVVPPVQNYNNNPYFTTVSESADTRQNVWQKIRVRFQNITGFLMKRFSFGGNNSFQTRQERPKEDLRRHSRYRGDELEIDCILTDDSYLLDSYNEKGEYSRLSGDTQGNMSVRK